MGYADHTYGSYYADGYGADYSVDSGYYGYDSDYGSPYGSYGGFYDDVGGGLYLNDPAFYDPSFYVYVPSGYVPGYDAPLNPNYEFSSGDAGYYGYGDGSGVYGYVGQGYGYTSYGGYDYNIGYGSYGFFYAN